ncbi:CoA transferase [Arthrobacter sp. MMS18-M83]|uniref:CoA transferase n=1 Tax=Arthrobacter sp. MMS18-M83 TaxID=2996261 RepID=UPI00227B8856|nr:CoA transferase [Arthrobacter sp. MMS18-M83]WAH96321.1 CoA transferase [Arthrobacter sp. MMS18-M83]
MSNGMLQGTLTVELGWTRAAAFTAKLIADAGGSVVTLEDESRRTALTDEARMFLDPHKDVVAFVEDQDTVVLEELIPFADLLVTDLPEEELARRGFDWDAIRALNPSISYVRLSAVGGRPGGGPGAAGPDTAALDTSGSPGELTMQALSGLMEMVGDPQREPLALPYGIGSLQLGLHGAAAGTAAMYTAARSGQGRLVEIAGAEVLASYVRIYGAVASYYGIPLQRDGRRAPGSGGRYPFGIFPCRDGYVAMICRSDREWTSLLGMMGNPEWSTRDRYRDLYAIAMEYPDEVDELIAPWLIEHTRDQLLDLAQEFAIPVAPVRSVAEVLEDAQLRDHRSFFDILQNDDGDTIQVPGRPWASQERRTTLSNPGSLDDVLQHRPASSQQLVLTKTEAS